MAFTGGGTGGHVFPGLAVLDRLRAARGVRVAWIGDSRGVEREIVRSRSVVFYGIPTGKLRRYASIRNVTDVFRVVAGVLRSIALLRTLRPAVLFSKGGFVSVPPVLAARLLGIPVITHESDADPGLATRINARSSERILVAYEATREHFRADQRDRVTVTGNPLRPEVLLGKREAGLRRLSFSPDDPRPLVMFLGGSLGARQINELVQALRPSIREQWRIVHQSGSQPATGARAISDAADGGDADGAETDYYRAPFFGSELADVLAAADVLVCRAGASTVWEGAALEKPMLLVPLSAGSRGDQVRNAAIFTAVGGAERFTDSATLVEDVREALERLSRDVGMREEMGKRARSVVRLDATNSIADIIASYCGRM